MIFNLLNVLCLFFHLGNYELKAKVKHKPVIRFLGAESRLNQSLHLVYHLKLVLQSCLVNLLKALLLEVEQLDVGVLLDFNRNTREIFTGFVVHFRLVR